MKKRIAAIAAVHGVGQASGPASIGTAGDDSKFVAADVAADVDVTAHGPDFRKGVELDAASLAEAYLSPLEIDEQKTKVDWQMKIDDARCKLKSI